MHDASLGELRRVPPGCPGGPPAPIAQTSDGQVKVMLLSGDHEGVFTYGDDSETLTLPIHLSVG